MKIGVLSDSHDHVELIKVALKKFKAAGVEAILHAGDFVAPFSAKLLKDADLIAEGVEVICVYGNNDGERKGLKNMLPQIAEGPVELKLGGRKIAMAHFIPWIDEEIQQRNDIIIGGHNHEMRNELIDGRLYLNPGECCGILTGRPTAAILETKNLTAEIIDLA